MVDAETGAWLAFGAFVVAMFAVDLALFGRGQREISLRRASIWSVGWTLLGLAFVACVLLWKGRVAAGEYLAGFLIEKSLSVDNLFVFALVLDYFAVPRPYQRRVLFWGIVAALVLRGLFILAGAALLEAFHATIYLFGGILIVTAVRMATHREVEIHPERNPLLRLLRRLFPLTPDYRGASFLVREQGGWAATPLAAAFLLVASFDVIFAVDSIPAIFAVTRDTFIVFAANAFSLLGLSALYFVLLGMLQRFRYLQAGLAVVLAFVGLKMVTADVVHLPVWLSLLVVVGVLAAAAGASLVFAPAGKGGLGRSPDTSPGLFPPEAAGIAGAGLRRRAEALERGADEGGKGG
jgi:tellurite resistance protein TerC